MSVARCTSLSLALGLAFLAGCGARTLRTDTAPQPPPAARFLSLVETDPVAAGPLAREILRSPLTDETTRTRVVSAWTAAVAPLEALRDARLADADALLAQGAVAAAAEAVHEAAELETAIGLTGAPRSAAELAREVEWARTAAERTAREAGERARGAWRQGDPATAAVAAAEARQLRNRAGLTADVNLAVLEGLSRRALPEPEPSAPILRPTEERVDRAAARPRPRPRPAESAPLPAATAAKPVAVQPAADPLADARHAWRTGDVVQARAALAAARAAGAAGPGIDDLEAAVSARRDTLVAQALEAAEAAYAREDLEGARAYWERVLALAPGHARALEGLSLYRRFLALRGR